jgi:hypothetical protein
VFSGLATVFAFFGSWWWGFDLAANFRWQLMWAALFAAIVYALTSRGIATILFIIAVVINGFVIAPLWLGSQPDGTGEDGTTVVSIDIYGGTDNEENMLRWLLDSGADVIIASGVTAERMLPLTADGSPYRILASPAFPDRSGIVVLGNDNYAVAEIATPEFAQQVVVVTVPAGASTVDIASTWGELANSARKADALAERLEAIKVVVEAAESPVAVIGNLGATRFTAGMRSLIGSTSLRDATEGSGYLATWPASNIPIIGGWIGIPIDVVLMTPEITPFELTTGPDIGAKHLPVTVVVGPTQQG